MSGINVASSPVVPAIFASAGTAGAAGGATTAVTNLPATGFGVAILIMVMAVTFVLVGLVLVWNPLGRGNRALSPVAVPTPPPVIRHRR